MILIIIIIIIILYTYNNCKESFEDVGHTLSVNNLEVDYSNKQYGGQKYNAIFKKKSNSRFNITKKKEGYQISPVDKDNLLLSINSNNGVLQFNNYTGFINKKNLDLDDPISRNKLRSTYWHINRIPDTNLYEIRSVRFPALYLYYDNISFFNSKCVVDGIVKFGRIRSSNWNIEPPLIN